MNLKVDSDMRLSSAFPTPFLFFLFYIFFGVEVVMVVIVVVVMVVIKLKGCINMIMMTITRMMN